MDKDKAKIDYLKKQLEDPDISDFQKQRIKARLGIESIYKESDFTSKHGDELLDFTFKYLNEQLDTIRRKKRTNTPLQFLIKNQKTVYYLSSYSTLFEQDTLEQLDNTDIDDINGLIDGLITIGRLADAEYASRLIKIKLKEDEIVELISHFCENEVVASEINIAVKKFILTHIKELLELQNL